MEHRLRVQPKATAKTLPARTDAQTETDWRDPWAATEQARRTLHDAQTAKPDFLADIHKVSRRITDEINADPMEVQKLRKARQEAREGRTSPRRNGTKSN